MWQALCNTMKSALFLTSIFLSLICVAGDLEFMVSSNEQGTVHLVTVLGSEQSEAELTKRWYEKIQSLCPAGVSKIEPSDKPQFRQKSCGDAVEVINGKQKCEEIQAHIFGKVICNAT